MRAVRWRPAVASACAALALAGCAGARIENGMFHAEGYRIALPAAGWHVVPDGRADLMLARDGAPGGMLVNATCGGRTARREFDALMHQLLVGLRERRIVERAAVSVNGRAAERSLFEGIAGGRPVRGEAYVVRDGACVYDLLYVAPPDAFDSGRGDFTRFVESLTGP